MRRITVSVLSVFIVLPAFGGALPVVNIGAGGVSARDAFGEGTPRRAAVSVSPAPKNVVARNTKKHRLRQKSPPPCQWMPVKRLPRRMF